MNQTQGVSGWQNLQPSLQPGDPTAQILGSQNPTGDFQVAQSPNPPITGGGTPQTGTLASLGMLAMLA